MDPIIWIIVAAVGLFGFGTVDAQEASPSAQLGPPPWVTGGTEGQSALESAPREARGPNGAQRLAQRVQYASCGEIQLDRGGEQSSDLVTGWACLSHALADERGAELRTTYFTVEGDPIHEYHRVTPAGRYEYFGDTREDGFGSQRVSFRECPTDDRFAGLGPPGPACVRS